MYFLQPITPVMVRVIEEPAEKLSVGNIIIQALGITGLLLVGSLLFGAILGGLFIWLRVRRPDNTLNGDGDAAYRLNLTSLPR